MGHYQEITKKKISISNIGKHNGPSPMKGKHHSEETKQLISTAKIGSVPWNKGVPISEETRNKLSASLKGRSVWSKGKKFSDEHRKNLSLNSGRRGISPPNKGMVMSQNDRDKDAISNGAKPFIVLKAESNEIIGIFINQHKCAEDLNISVSKINTCLHGHRKSHKGYIFRYVEQPSSVTP